MFSLGRRLVVCLAISVSLGVEICACAAAERPADPTSPCDGVELLVAASDYTSSLVCGAPRCERGPGTTGLDLGKDPQLTASNGRAFFLARDKDLVFELDPACGTPTARYSVHIDGPLDTSNPHDVAAAANGALFVALFNVPRIVILEGGKITDSIDLRPYDDDGNPQAEGIRIVRVGGVEKAFVTLERLDASLKPKQAPSMMLRIDVATHVVEAAIELAGRNPFNAMAEHDGGLFLAAPGSFDALAEPGAGVERFDSATSTTKLLTTEADLGGSVAEVAVTNDCGVAIVAGPEHDVNPTTLVTFDPVTGRPFRPATNPLYGPTPGYDLQGLAWRGNTLYVGDRRAGSTGFPVHVFERTPGTCDLRDTTQTIALPQRPVALRAAR